MTVLVCYDVATSSDGGARRLRRVARACKSYGVRVQYSVFECKLEAKDWISLRTRLLSEYDAKQDSLRFYFLSEDDAEKTEHHGMREPLDVTGGLVV